jgi:hypothetical protein
MMKSEHQMEHEMRVQEAQATQAIQVVNQSDYLDYTYPYCGNGGHGWWWQFPWRVYGRGGSSHGEFTEEVLKHLENYEKSHDLIPKYIESLFWYITPFVIFYYKSLCKQRTCDLNELLDYVMDWILDNMIKKIFQ